MAGTFTSRYLKKRGAPKAWNDPAVLAINCVEGKAPGNTHTSQLKPDRKVTVTRQVTIGRNVIVERVEYNQNRVAMVGNEVGIKAFDARKCPIAPTKSFTAQGMAASGSDPFAK